jgi:biopolymer transport protein ExbD
MLLTRQKRKAPNPQLNMTPMIDCIFQLLIFFMCTASFIHENNLMTQMPSVGTGQKVEEELPPVRIAVGGAGKNVLVTCDDQPCPTFDSLVRQLQQRRKIGDLQVIIDGQGAVPFAYMVGALDACHQADLFKVAFSPRGIGR